MGGFLDMLCLNWLVLLIEVIVWVLLLVLVVVEWLESIFYWYMILCLLFVV